VTPPTMVVLHLSTGHVLASATATELVPTADALTGGTYIAVRISGDRFVNVTTEMLTALQASVDDDVLSRPTHFQVVKAVPPLSQVGAPTQLAAGKIGDPGAEAVSLWQVGHVLEVVRDKLDSTGALPTNTPPGATHRLVAVAGQPLRYAP
jgi:hypothetical protein